MKKVCQMFDTPFCFNEKFALSYHPESGTRVSP